MEARVLLSWVLGELTFKIVQFWGLGQPRTGVSAPHQKRKRPSRFLSTAFIYAGNDLLSHTLGACSTIGPAGLNFRVRDGNGWIPRGKITDNSIARGAREAFSY